MPSVSIRNCRKFVQATAPFRASTMRGEWADAADGTKLYVVTSSMKRRHYSRYPCILFVHHDGKWYERSGLSSLYRHKREMQMYYARPLPSREMIRRDGNALAKFLLQGLVAHPDMERLISVSV